MRGNMGSVVMYIMRFVSSFVQRHFTLEKADLRSWAADSGQVIARLLKVRRLKLRPDESTAHLQRDISLGTDTGKRGKNEVVWS